ncbi:hypothetical protein ACHAPJ_005147 [Fusarium lateritium]
MGDNELTKAQKAQKERMYLEIDRVLAESSNRDRALRHFQRALGIHYTHPFEEPSRLLPVEELERRRHFADWFRYTIRRVHPQFELKSEHVAALLALPLSYLVELPCDIKEGKEVKECLERIFQFSQHFLQKLTKADYEKSQASRSTTASLRSDSGSTSLVAVSPHSAFEHPGRITGVPGSVTGLPHSLPGSRRSVSGPPELRLPRSVSGSHKRVRSESGVPVQAETNRPEDIKSNTKIKTKVYRNQTERGTCLKRDGHACIVTNLANPQVCHIVPFSFNDDKDNVQKTSSLFSATKYMVGEEFLQKYESYLANPSVLGASDKPWNMICLNSQLHTWWARGYLAFKCLGIDPPRQGESDFKVKLQFHWMPMLKKRIGEDITVTGAGTVWENIASELELFHSSGNKQPVPRDGYGEVRMELKSGEQLETGHIFYVEMDGPNSILFKAMIDVQWACIMVHTMSAAAGSLELPQDEDPDDYIEQWLESQAKIPAEERPITDEPSAPHDKPPVPNPFQDLLPRDPNLRRQGQESLALRPLNQPRDWDSSPEKQKQRTEQVQTTATETAHQRTAQDRQAENRPPPRA